MALAEFTGVLPKYVALDVGDTHAPGVGVLAFNVNSRFVLNFASQADFADSVALSDSGYDGSKAHTADGKGAHSTDTLNGLAKILTALKVHRSTATFPHS